MIGQVALINTINRLLKQNIYPQFSIIDGSEGSGKKTICKETFGKTAISMCFVPDNKVETVRNVIVDSYKATEPTMYIFTDVDDMSVQAKNALLKVTEEPPKSAFFVMTVCDLNTVLDTIKSRATIVHMKPYTAKEISQYASKYNDSSLYAELCVTPGEVDKLHDMNVEEFYSYVEKVVDNIAYVSLANVFKIESKIAFKPDDKGYDMRLFLVAFQRVCQRRMIEDIEVHDDCVYWIEAIKIVAQVLKQMRVTGINKSALFDRFILEIRKVWS